MGRNKSINVTSKSLGIALIAALILQYVFPAIKLGSLSFIGTLIILLVAIVLLLR